MSERMIIDALPVRNNILLGIMEIKTGNVVVDAMIQSAFRVCIEELDGAPVVEVPEWRRASDPPPTHNETWHDGDEVYSGETSMKVWASRMYDSRSIGLPCSSRSCFPVNASCW